jgi:hypothetical protein
VRVDGSHRCMSVALCVSALVLGTSAANYLIRTRFWVGLRVPATILKIIGERIGRRVLDNEQRSYFVTCFAFARLVLGYAPLLLKLGVCCKSLI